MAYDIEQAFVDGFEQCRAQVRDLFNNPALDTRAKIKEALEAARPHDSAPTVADMAKRYGEYIGVQGLQWFGDNWGMPHGNTSYTSDDVYSAFLVWHNHNQNNKQ